MIGVPSILALTVSLIARRYSCLIELSSPVYVGVTSLTHLVFNVTVHDSQINVQDFKSWILVIYSCCFISIFFLTPSYLNQVLARQLLGPPVLWLVFISNGNLGKDKFN